MSLHKVIVDKDLRKMAEEHPDWRVEQTKATHLKWTHIPSGKIVFTSGKNIKDRRAYRKIECALRRVEAGGNV
jgi:hypothetical protein